MPRKQTCRICDAEDHLARVRLVVIHLQTKLTLDSGLSQARRTRNAS